MRLLDSRRRKNLKVSREEAETHWTGQRPCQRQTETQTICGQLWGVVWENREAFEASQPPKSFLCSVTGQGAAGGGPCKGSLQPFSASHATCMLYMHTWGHPRHKGSLQNLPELLGLKLLGEVFALESQCFPVPSPLDHQGWLSQHHAGAQLSHLYPGLPAVHSGETQGPGAWEPHGHTYDRI